MGLIYKAALFARSAHKGQIRKYTGEDYFIHPQQVALIVQSVSMDSEVIAAALLHDVVEDTKYTNLDIAQNFGKRIAKLVAEVTDISKLSDGNRKQRKYLDLMHLSKASTDGQTIKLADLIHNSESILKYDEKFAKIYMQEKQDLLQVLNKGNKILYDRAIDIVDNYFKTLNRERYNYGTR